MIYLSLILQDQKNTELYKKLIETAEYKISNYENFEVDELSSDICIVDINDKHGFNSLKKISFKKNSFVIVISPYMQKYIDIFTNLKSTNNFYITKPINIPKFKQILQDAKYEIQKKIYLKTKEEILIKGIDDAPLRVAMYDRDGNMLCANEPYILHNKLQNINNIHFNNLVNCNLELQDIFYNLKVRSIYITEKKQDNKWFKSFFYLTKDTKTLVHICTDKTQEQLYINSLKKSAQFFQKSNEGAVITDAKGVILLTNDSFCSITGYTKDEVEGEPISILNSGTHDNGFYENMWDTLKHHGRWQGEIWNKRKNEEIYPEWLSITKIIDEHTGELNYMAIFTDITSLKEADKKLHFYANHDHLTGLLNKVQFENMLDQTIKSAVRNNKKFALLYVDLDYFKNVNDTAGHNIGDLLLKELARRFQKTLRKEDIISRIGGDEFTVILDNITEVEDALILANKLNDATKKVFSIDNKNFYLSLSIGIAIFPYHGLNAVDLAKNADSAMYEVKNGGRDGVLSYNKKFTDELVKKIQLHNDLKKAIESKDFEVYYQPVVDIQTQKITGAEALIRWKHKTKGFIPPDDFIKIAEHHGLISEITNFVLDSAFESLPAFLSKFGDDFILSVNISSKDFEHDSFVNQTIEKVKDFHIDPKNVELEITETFIMQNQNSAIIKMQKLVEAGFNIAIDDFGTGYSSLSYLKKFPVNKLKIDKSFIFDITDDIDSKEMVIAIINIAKIFQLQVQAEGVESQVHLDFLRENGADIAQGYLYSKPITFNEIISNKWSFKL